MKQCKWYPVCPMKRYYENGVLDTQWVRSYCWNGGDGCVRYAMEQRGEPHPDWMLPDGTIDTRLKEYDR
jgi:DNA polymerase